MDGSTSMLQSSEIVDTIMEGDDQEHLSNGHAQNGFMDPRVLITPEDDTNDSTQPTSQDDSQNSSDMTKAVIGRKHFLPTGCCYDDRMKLHANADFSANAHHPEDPRRIEAIMQEFKDAGLIYSGTQDKLNEILKISPNAWMWRIAARKATPQEICLVHEVSHYEWVKSLSLLTSAQLRQLTTDFDNGRKSLYVGNLTYEAALISAGGAIETCKNVVAGRVKNAIAVIRPPGHHAEHNESLGFCIFNNVPIAASVCMQDYPELCRKILILDWDVHHGNGIQNMFYEEPNVLYISLHVYANGEFYPGQPEDPSLPDGGINNVGRGPGQGRNVNIGWSEQGVGDGEYMAAFQRIVMPIAQEFNPDLVIVSAGFDAAAGDDLGGCWVTPACYSHMTHMLMSLANGKVAVCLEGGYNLRAISRSALAVAKTLMGEPPERMTIPPLNKEASNTLDQVKRQQAPYWDCMRVGVVDPEHLQPGTDRLDGMIRTAQKSILSDKYGMIPIYIQRNKLSRSFDNQVLATPELHSSKKILLIIHDPVELFAQPDPYDNQVLSHNAYVNDTIRPYIDWAITNGFGVVDVNIPKELSSPSETDPFEPKATEGTLREMTKELLCYLWDNYFEINPSSSITLMGVGDAYLGIKELLISRDAKSKIPCILSFVSGSLRPVKSDMDPYLSTWYKSNSLIYVSPDHACWSDDDSSRKVKKQRFGNVLMADIEVGQGPDNVGRMLKRYEEESATFISQKVEDWERERGDMDPDETEDEAEAEARNLADQGFGMQGVVQSVRVPVV
ncbi:histone deacetylase-like protein [Stipitochalara longipes BDJ]|nr:histone deacetylase-like protein [Stipitochalara longipes BDJ]